jgi:hypothetical protein
MKQTIKKQILELINKYLKRENKICLDVRKEWKQEINPSYPRIYSNQYYAFMELRSFWKELKKIEELSCQKV